MATRPWTEADYPPGILLKRNDPSTIAVPSSGFVANDPDLSGNGYHDIQPTASLQPAYLANGINGLAVEKFTGVEVLTTTFKQNPSLISFIFVVQRNNGAGSGTLFGGFTGGIQMRIEQDGSIQFNREGVAAMGNSGGGLRPDVGVNAIYVGSYNATTGEYSFRINGTQLATGTSKQSLDANNSTIGAASNNTNSESFKGLIGERDFIASMALSDIQLAEGKLAWKWGLQGSLPAAHPYKAAAPTVDTGGTPAPTARRRAIIITS